ncbi:fibronectin type III domain-containing protein [Hahella sp. HN01]|uniref:fibronectin type III domain-containing protein n=1 Tax=Hahella sp. HN01 TaxID=2847262 RepID=UPI001C1E93C2|nr:fibronectin type III domain-containing protein [Hahella sp. HN01]MBU6951078.1 fibronectin type III domain-containing protein [Hahella sp. HN01]
MQPSHHRFAAACLAFLLALLAGAASAEIKPYLQSPTDTSIWISWKTATGSESKVEYGVAADRLDQSANGGVQSLSSDYQYHGVQLQGLQADTLYYYRVKTGADVSAVYRFKTQPARGDGSGHYRILVMGDHQIRNENRYEQLVKAAKAKLENKYAEPIEEAVNLILNDGDQVDVGTLDHYANLHFAQSAAISPNVPIMTTVGNHEYYYDGDLNNYRAHFFYDGLSYQGISGAPNESYYAYQVGRLVVIHMNSMKADAVQQNWLTQVVAAADADASVDWIISIIHHPYQAEQYIGDISHPLRDAWMAILSSSQKHVLNIGGHHHLYARGQTREWPSYHMISGGTAWDQYWGQSTEKDFDDVQKTIANWAWQVIDLDLPAREMTVETYAEAHPLLYKTKGFHYNSRLIDSFHRKLDLQKPYQPSITTEVKGPVSLPFVFNSSPFSSGEPEEMNSTQFQIAADAEFSDLKIDKIRDFENIFGDTGAPEYEPVDIHAGVDILAWEIPANGLPNGDYYIRVRHRDKNILWSDWSEAKAFTVGGSTDGEPGLSVSKDKYRSGEDVVAHHQNGYGNAKDWVGVYKKGQIPGAVRATKWSYVDGPTGSLTFSGLADGEYFVGFFENDGYSEMAERAYFYMGPVAELTMTDTEYDEGEVATVSWSGSSGAAKDWIGVYRVGEVPGQQSSSVWKYAPETAGTVDFSGLAKGYYFAAFFINDGYTEASNRVYFSVGDRIAELSLLKTHFESGEDIVANFSGGPGVAKDYLGIFEKGAVPGQTGSELVAYLYFDGAASGSVTFTDDLPDGEYFMAMYTNDSYTEVSNRVTFSVGEAAVAGDLNGDGVADSADRDLLRSMFGKCNGDAGYQTDADYDGDGCIGRQDYRLWYAMFKSGG